MGTHPIFESDFDCLTEFGNFNSQGMLLKSALLFASAYGAALTFEHKKPTLFKPETKVSENPFGKDMVEDYESKDGTYKYHAEFHSREFDPNKDGFGNNPFGGIEQELNKMMENAFNIDSIFGKMMPSFPNMFDRFQVNPDQEVIEQVEGSGDSKPLFIF